MTNTALQISRLVAQVAWFVFWAAMVVVGCFAAAHEFWQTPHRVPDGFLILSYAGFAAVLLFVSVRRSLRRCSVGLAEKPSTPMRVSYILLYTLWLSASISVIFVAQREANWFDKHGEANVLRAVGVVMVAIWLFGLRSFRLSLADQWDRPGGSQGYDSFKIGCALIVVPAATAVIAWFVMVVTVGFG